jgi:hypothetical protein
LPGLQLVLQLCQIIIQFHGIVTQALPTNTAETGSLSLCTSNFLWLPSDPPLASDALAIRIIFPSVGVILLSCKQTGLPASPSKPRKRLQPSCRHAGPHHQQTCSSEGKNPTLKRILAVLKPDAARYLAPHRPELACSVV